MAETSEITWTDATFNPWIGCTKVGPACDFCYAERDNVRRKWVEAWGPGIPRKRTSAANWQQPIRWNNAAGDFFAQHGRKRRVFAASLADIFDNEVDQAWRDDFWALVKATPNLQWLIVTKRIGNAEKMLPADWGDGYPNVVLIITVANQAEAARDTWKLLTTPAAARGLSIEPMLGPIDLTDLCNGSFFYDALGGSRWHDAPPGVRGASARTARLDWVIAGGESDGGAGTARPLHSSWIKRLVRQCAQANVAFHFKQWGEWGPDNFGVEELRTTFVAEDGRGTSDESADILAGKTGTQWEVSVRYGKKKAGRKVDGVTHDGFPAQ